MKPASTKVHPDHVEHSQCNATVTTTATTAAAGATKRRIAVNFIYQSNAAVTALGEAASFERPVLVCMHVMVRQNHL